jgi:hypothetical protein
MDDYGTNLGERYAAEAITKYYSAALSEKITNSDYERILSQGGASLIKVKTFGDLTIHTYASGTPMTADTPSESEATFDPDQQKALYYELFSIAQFEDYVKNVDSKLYEAGTKQLVETVNTYILSLYADAGSGNRVGVNHSAGTVTVAVTTGEVAGVGTGWTAGTGWQGLGFKCPASHTKWYRIQPHADQAITATSLFIMDDSDDDSITTGTDGYTGGAVSAGAAYEIEATAVKNVTVDNIFDQIDDAATNLTENKVPKGTDVRWIVLPARIASVLRRSEELQLPVAAAYEDVIKKGLIGNVAGFSVYENEEVAGNSNTGWYCMYGHKSAITFAIEFKTSKIEEDIVGEFGMRHKALWVKFSPIKVFYKLESFFSKFLKFGETLNFETIPSQALI